MLPAAITSIGITTTQKNQYSQPTVKPARSPRPRRANSVNERTCGLPTAISPIMRMTSSISTPVRRYVSTTAGPVTAMAALLLTNSPAPTMPPMVIMNMCRGRRLRLSSVSAGCGTAADMAAAPWDR